MKLGIWVLSIASAVLSSLGSLSVAAEDLAYLDEMDPYYVSRDFPKLTTPQWVGEEDVEAVIILSIDDMRDWKKYEDYLRPILTRLHEVAGKAPLSIMACSIDPKEPQLQRWLDEGLSIETHTVSHPCPLLCKKDFAAARNTYEQCVDTLSDIPGYFPVAFRMPCCDSLNTVSPRFFAEIFNKRTAGGHYLEVDSSVFNVFTPNDPALDRALVLDPDGRERFRKYLPFSSFVNTINDYPYPYVLGKLCWEFPCIVPSDWEAQNLNKPYHPQTVADMKAAIDATVAKQGVYTLVFHPHGWIQNTQVVELIDHAVSTYGKRIRFMSFLDALDRIETNLLDGQSLRASCGDDNGVRLLDLNRDGFLDVVIGNANKQETRNWNPGRGAWDTKEFPATIVRDDEKSHRHDNGVRFGVIDNKTAMLVANDSERAAWVFDSGAWKEFPKLAKELRTSTGQIVASSDGVDRGVRFRDLDGDGQSELIASSPSQQAVLSWNAKSRAWTRCTFTAPGKTNIADNEGRDAGALFVDLDSDGDEDVIFSNEATNSAYLFESMDKGWSHRIFYMQRDPADPKTSWLPPFVAGGENQGAWVHSRSIWWQNESTDGMPDLVDRRAFNDFLSTTPPKAKSPEASLRSIQTRPKFKIELVAAEPLVHDPIAIDWDDQGRMWVVEMRDYPRGIDDKGKFGSQVRFLEDTDGDGKYDRSTLFLDDLGFATSAMPWRDGLLITCAPSLLFARDTDGDGRADDVKSLFEGFGEGNPQHRLNCLRWGLDNWIYGANGDSGGQIKSLISGDVVPIRGRDFRIRVDGGLLDPQCGQAQYGRVRDDWGNWFGCANWAPFWYFALDDIYLRRNPHFAAPDSRQHLFESRENFPISPTQPRFNDYDHVNQFTSACGLEVYRDTLLGDDFFGNQFICEPVHNLVSRRIIEPNGTGFAAKRAVGEETREFLASTDNWFRPVMARTGPDGALYVVDMYRGVIEHPEYISEDTQRVTDFRAGEQQGRIYRVYPIGATLRPLPLLHDVDVRTLVDTLRSENGPSRDLAHRLLYERMDRSAVSLLEALLQETTLPQTQLHALGLLDGLHALTDDEIVHSLKHEHPAVRRFAARLASDRVSSSPALAHAVAALASDSDASVRMQAAYSLGNVASDEAAEALARLAQQDGHDANMIVAIMSSAQPANLNRLVEPLLALSQNESIESDTLERVESALVVMAIQPENAETARRLLARICTKTVDGYGAWQLRIAANLAKVLSQRESSIEAFAADAASDILAYARSEATNEDAEAARRAQCIALLGWQENQRTADIALLGGFVDPRMSAELRSPALDALRQINEPLVAETLISLWSNYSPEIREEALDVLLSRQPWLETLLVAIEQEKVSARQIDPGQRQKLLTHEDESVKKRSEALFAQITNTNRQAVIERFKDATTLTGDPGHGSELFKELCSKCHQLGGVGFHVGPDLTTLTDRSPDTLLTAILDPNRAVETKYISYDVVTTDWTTVSGILAAETATGITLLSANGQESTILRTNIDRLKASSMSLMPEGLEEGWKSQDAADLIAFVAHNKQKPKTFAGNTPQTIRANTQDGAFVLSAATAEVYGNTLVFEPQHQNLGYWGSENDAAVWTLEVEKDGDYEVTLDYCCDSTVAGNEYALTVGGNTVLGRVSGTGTWIVYRERSIGKVNLKQGVQRLSFRSRGPINGYLLDLRSILLHPAAK